ncbi:rhodanese-like domain-containing protein [Ichthyenterobacterium sp. W332]|uniref:Rhodanese-like domain-containing protein n=1 Tax=Microcosmobacter mediterraneus TaxID=3075607 RepID=A0ABU2YKT6_9FLAO|nr:rhodanese-like domain-containing protein [Ichthyenterobacterium sp. W332]MDT0558506.1 rhodanese-like domain-containing protein [Ichthyenterobacterium sp. W332]
MKEKILYILLLFTSIGYAQETLSELLKQYNTQAVPYITVQELAMPKTNAIILDAREEAEYNISHIKDALNVGYDRFNIETIINKINNKNAVIVVYCSLGIRSEDIAEKLKKVGYHKVYNLYGGIFEWKNAGFKVYDINSKITDNVHAFSKEWSVWLTKGNKVYE